MGNKSRADRRHHHDRMKQKVSKFYWIKKWFGTEESREEHIRQMAETRKPCSCYMCGNPRKHWKDKTMQEKRFEEKIWSDDEC
jgi:hypothetical protein